MPRSRASFTTGLALGLGATLLYAVAKRVPAPIPESLIGWEWAARVAVRVSGREGRLSPGERESLGPYYRSMVDELEGPIAAYTGTHLPQATRVYVMDRRGWIRANVANFRELFAPIDSLYVDVTRSGPATLPGVPHASQAMLSAQVGALLGFLARKVLGQYDMSLLGREPISGGKLYFVEPNIRALESALGVPVHDLRRWIALHESTHAHEFEVYPWVRSHMNDLLERYLRSVVDDMRQAQGGTGVVSFINRLVENLRGGRSLLEAMMTAEQRDMVSRLQGLMSLAEGYSNHVMNAVGRTLLPSFDLIHDRVENRQRQRGRSDELFLRLTGLKMKMDQYRLGEAFADHVAEQRGIDFLNKAWEAAEYLPTEWEIQQPDAWIRRIEGQLSLRPAPG